MSSLNSVRKFFWLLLFFPRLALSLMIPPSAPFIDHFFGLESRPFTRIHIGPEGLRINDKAVLKADHVILEGPLLTQGHALYIDTRRLEFRGNGKILGVDTIPPPIELQAAEGRAGYRGKDWSEISEYEGYFNFLRQHQEAQDYLASFQEIPEHCLWYLKIQGRGVTGGSGEKGAEGLPGISASLPRSQNTITLASQEIVGTPWIDAVGECGGKGGEGGKGGRGGQGGQGRKGEAHAIGDRNTNAGQGGNAGLRGAGGDGGVGGAGGCALPLIFLTSQPLENLCLSQIQSKPGQGGPGGDPGDPGELGLPGPGGLGDHSQFGIFNSSVDVGPEGNRTALICGQSVAGKTGCPGTNCPANHPILRLYRPLESKGSVKQEPTPALLDGIWEPNKVIRSYASLEKIRLKTIEAWFQFHWIRNLKILVQNSLDFIQFQEAYRQNENDFLFLRQRRQKRAQDLAHQWRDSFTAPLKSFSQNSLGEERLEKLKKILDFAEPFEEAMEAIAEDQETQMIAQKIALASDALNVLYQTHWEEALESCVHYHDAKSPLDAQILGISSHFGIPVCSSLRQWTQAESLLMPIETMTALSGQKPPPGVVIEVVSPEQSLPSFSSEDALASSMRGLSVSLNARLMESDWLHRGLGQKMLQAIFSFASHGIQLLQPTLAFADTAGVNSWDSFEGSLKALFDSQSNNKDQKKGFRINELRDQIFNSQPFSKKIQALSAEQQPTLLKPIHGVDVENELSFYLKILVLLGDFFPDSPEDFKGE